MRARYRSGCMNPPIADFIGSHAVLRTVVRILLTPIVLLSKMLLAMPLLTAGLIILIGAAILTRIGKRQTRISPEEGHH